MQLISSRTIPYLDRSSLAAGKAREILFRRDNGSFILYLSDGKQSSTERAVRLELREALIWLNEPPEEQGSFWT